MATLKEMMASKKKAINEASGRREKTAKPKDGKSRWRILPSWRGEGDIQFFHDFGQHFIKDEQGAMKAVYVCVDKTFSKPCPICEQIESAIFASKTDALKKMFKEMKARGNVLVNALNIDAKSPVPVILELTPTTFSKFIDIIEENADEENPDFNILTDIEGGVDIIITRTGAGLNTEYGVQPALKGSKPVEASVLEKLHNLDEYVAQEYEQGLSKALNALSSVSGKKALAAPASTDEEFDDDVPDYSSDSDDVIEGDYVDATTSEPNMDEEELSDLLSQLED